MFAEYYSHLFFYLVLRAGERGERDHREDGEYRRLDETNEEFKSEEGDGCDIGDERAYDDKEHFAGEDIAEESE